MVLFTKITIALFYLNLWCKNTIQQLFSFVTCQFLKIWSLRRDCWLVLREPLRANQQSLLSDHILSYNHYNVKYNFLILLWLKSITLLCCTNFPIFVKPLGRWHHFINWSLVTIILTVSSHDLVLLPETPTVTLRLGYNCEVMISAQQSM